MDHVVPYSWDNVKERKKKAGSAGRGLKVPCCRDCNTLLGNRLLHTIAERRAYIAEQLTRRAPKIIEWSNTELDELGPGLRGMVEALDTKARHLKARAANARK